MATCLQGPNDKLKPEPIKDDDPVQVYLRSLVWDGKPRLDAYRTGNKG